MTTSSTLPKRPKNAFLLFCDQYRPIVKAETPGRSATEYSKACSAKWNSLSTEERAVYQAEAKKLASAFREECPNYHYISKMKKITKEITKKPSSKTKLVFFDSLHPHSHAFQESPFLFQAMLAEKREREALAQGKSSSKYDKLSFY
jgi:hypothetical protein